MNVHAATTARSILLATGYCEDVSDDAAAEFEVIRKPYGADTLGAKLSEVVRTAPFPQHLR